MSLIEPSGHVPPAAAEDAKQPTAVFLGRLVPGKGLDALLDALPATWTLLRGRMPGTFEVQIAGYGALERQVSERVTSLRAQGVPIRFVGYAEAGAVLAPAAATLSMQGTTNLPSRVVAEALIGGCGVIDRDTGDSRQFREDLPGLTYCGVQLRADELAHHVATLTASVLDGDTFGRSVRAAALERFCSPHYIDCFHGVLFGDRVTTSSHAY